MRWFRFYDEALDDPKVQRLSHESFHVWVNLLCVASRNSGHIPEDMTDLAFSMRMQPARLDSQIRTLIAAGLIDRDDGLRPHNWDGRQYESDSSAERMRRHRQRKRDGEVTSHVTVGDDRSDVPDTEQNRTEQSRTDINSALSAPMETTPDGKSKRGTRLAANWEPDIEDRAFAEQLGLDADAQAAEFRDYWCGVPGAKGCKLDWSATWRNRCRDVAAKRRQLAGGSGRMVHRQGPSSLVAAVREAIIETESRS